MSRSLAEAEAARRAEAEADADARAAADLERRARERLETAYADLERARSAELRREAADRLTAVGVQGRALFHAALAESYRDAVLAFARSRQAHNIRHGQQDGVLDIEFEFDI